VRFGANLTYERHASMDPNAEEQFDDAYEFTTALNYLLIDNRLSVGAQFIVEYETEREREAPGLERETEHETEILLGPTILWRPTRSMYAGLAPLFGLNHDSPTVEAFFLIGFDFEPFARSRSGSDAERNGQFEPLRRPR